MTHWVGPIVGGLSILVGVGWIFGSIRRQLGRAENAPTYAAMGGPLYMIFQLGCGGFLVLAGLLIVGFFLAVGSR